ncbi:MAG: hypothetical protein V4608_04995 [Bacteroidota bacterium]
MLDNATNKKYLILFLFALSFIVYARTLNYGFVWDDERIHLTSNQQLMQGDIKSFWSKPYSGMYIPVSYTTWAFVKNTSDHNTELSPKPFHLLNILTHSINCILVFQLLLLLFKNQAHAFWASILFLLHPIQVESVAWISEFRGLCSAFFSLLALIGVFKYFEKNLVFTLRSFITSRHFIIASFLFVLALLSKPSAIVLPCVAGVLAWRFYRDNFKTIWKGLLIWVLLLLPILVITKASQPNDLAYSGISLWQRFFIAGDSFFFYFSKLVFPYPLAVCYGNTPELIVSDKLIYLTTAVCLAIVCFLFIKRKLYPLLFSGVAIIVICVLPVLGLVPFEYQKHATVADRYVYFGMLGVALFVPLIMERVKQHAWLKFSLLAVLLFYLVLNIQQTTTWKNEFTVWDHTLKHYQNSSKVYYNRGVEYSKMKKYPEAISDYTNSLVLEPRYLDALFNRANAYENVNNTVSAFYDYNTYLSIDANDGSVYFKRAHLNYKTGNIQEAIADVEKAERLGFPVSAKFKKKLHEH